MILRSLSLIVACLLCAAGCVPGHIGLDLHKAGKNESGFLLSI